MVLIAICAAAVWIGLNGSKAAPAASPDAASTAPSPSPTVSAPPAGSGPSMSAEASLSAPETQRPAGSPTVGYSLKFSGASTFSMKGSVPDGLKDFCKPATTQGGRGYIDYITLDQQAGGAHLSLSVRDLDGPGKSPTTVLATVETGFDSTSFIWEKGAAYSRTGAAVWKSPTRISLNLPAYDPVGRKTLKIVGTITCNGY